MALLFRKMWKRIPVVSHIRFIHVPYPTVIERKVEFICGDRVFIGKGKVGDSLLDVVLNNDLPMDGFGACEGSLACCTCHVVLDAEHFSNVNRLNPPSEEELDLLTYASELEDSSRLGCQVKILMEDPRKISVMVPSHKRDIRALFLNK